MTLISLLTETTPAPDAVATTLSFFDTPAFWKIVGVLSVIVGAIVVRVIAHFVVQRVVDQIVTGVKKRQNVDDTQSLPASPITAVRVVQRTRTLGSILNNIISIFIVIVGLVLIVNIIDENLIGSFALLTAALGAGLGFGAQNIVKDVLNGLFMVAEDQLGVGDVVDTGQATGVVEAVGVRITQIRDVNGTLWFVRNGEIIRVGNMSQGWSRVIIDLAVPYETDLEQVQTTMLDTANALAASGRWRSRILEKPEIWGLESISAEALVVRLVIKTRTTAKDDVARELRLRLKTALDAQGVKLPALNSIVLSGFEGAASVTGAKPPRTKPAPVVTTEGGKPVKPPRAPRKRPVVPLGSADRRGAGPGASERFDPVMSGLQIGGTPPLHSFWEHIGGRPTFEKLVRRFYEGVREDELLWPMYPADDLEGAIQRLTGFLEQYWGGPTTYSQERGHPRLRMRHMPFHIDFAARDAWLRNMRDAVDALELSPADDALLWDYLERAAHAMVNAH